MAFPAVRLVLVLTLSAFGGLFFVWPITAVIYRGLAGAELSALTDVLGSASIRGVLWFTIWQALLSTILTLLLALPAAGAVARLRFRGQRLVRALVIVPFVLPTVVVAAAFSELFDRFGLNDGVLQMRNTVWAILIAHVFFNYAVVVRTVGAYWSTLDTRMEDQAQVLGASRSRVFWEVTFPRLKPAITAAAVIVFLFSFTSFATVLILGGPARATLETEIYRYAIHRVELTSASSLALLQLVTVVGLVLWANKLEHKYGNFEPVSRVAMTRRAGFGTVIHMTLMFVMLGLPIAVLVERSFTNGDSGYSLQNYSALTERINILPTTVLSATTNSLIFAVAATALAVLVGGLVAAVVLLDEWKSKSIFKHICNLGFVLPLGVSPVVIGLGYLLVLNRPPINLRTSVLIVPIAHAVVGIPFVVRTLVSMIRTINPRLREAASVIGASPLRTRLEIDLPVALQALTVGASFAFVVSLGEFGATSFLPRRSEMLTAPLALYRLLGTPGETLQGQAMALGVILILLTAVIVFVVDFAGDARHRAF